MESTTTANADPPYPSAVRKGINSFLRSFNPHERIEGGKIPVLRDEASRAYYLTCHLTGDELSNACDSEASLDGGEEDEIYKLNRDIEEDKTAYQQMEQDAQKGRSFEDIVLEYDTSYRPKKPLKVYGGQHRLKAITAAREKKGSVLHGVRVYFALSREQKVEIAIISNTAIAVSNDLLDRTREQLLGPELRNWCQTVGLLEKGQDFAPTRAPDIPTVRLARTLLLNFFLGLYSDKSNGLYQPVLCKSGGMDADYNELRQKIDWSDPQLLEMGKQFARLNCCQRETVINRKDDNNAEFARKALSLSVVASWAFAAGHFQGNAEFLKNHYSIPAEVAPPQDALNAKALSKACHKGVDPDTYRGLGTRSSAGELGRMLEVFLVLAEKGKKRITLDLANAAIQSYEAKKAGEKAKRALEKI